ncbi:MAG: hypothetical protein K2I42_03725 [Anaeroplasmataceae bacterium]|nr:hypothetical protein [Anaeroplasmataceae bacterium]
MAFWNKKRGNTKLANYFTSKGIEYEMTDGQQDKVTFTLVFKNRDFILHPYLTLEDNYISFNINVVKCNLKNFDMIKLNTFNLSSKFFKAFISEEGIVILEYRFLESDLEMMLDILISDLYSLEEEIDAL